MEPQSKSQGKFMRTVSLAELVGMGISIVVGGFMTYTSIQVRLSSLEIRVQEITEMKALMKEINDRQVQFINQVKDLEIKILSTRVKEE